MRHFKERYIYKHVGLTIPPTRILPQLRTMMKSNNDDDDDDDDDDDAR